MTLSYSYCAQLFTNLLRGQIVSNPVAPKLVLWSRTCTLSYYTGCEWDFEKRAEIIIKKKIQSNRHFVAGGGGGARRKLDGVFLNQKCI